MCRTGTRALRVLADRPPSADPMGSDTSACVRVLLSKKTSKLAASATHRGRKPRCGSRLRLFCRSSLSPYHHVRAGVPPAIIFHGKNDVTVTYKSAEQFAAAMKRAGNRCELVGYAGQPHGFFNYRNGKNKYYYQTVIEADKFLSSLGYLKGKPTLKN